MPKGTPKPDTKTADTKKLITKEYFFTAEKTVEHLYHVFKLKDTDILKISEINGIITIKKA